MPPRDSFTQISLTTDSTNADTWFWTSTGYRIPHAPTLRMRRVRYLRRRTACKLRCLSAKRSIHTEKRMLTRRYCGFEASLTF